MLAPFFQYLADEGALTLTVRVRPNATMSTVVTILQDGSLKIALKAPAEDGKANAALISFLAHTFSVHATQVAILSGKTTRIKLVRITAASVPAQSVREDPRTKATRRISRR